MTEHKIINRKGRIDSVRSFVGGWDMTRKDQNVEMWSGDDIDFVVPVYDASGNLVDLTLVDEVEFIGYDGDGNVVIAEKTFTGGGITMDSGGIPRIHVLSGDTSGLKCEVNGKWECDVVLEGRRTTVVSSPLSIKVSKLLP